MDEAEEALVRMEGIEKHFAGVHALKDCRFELLAGEVHGLVGENGAGKSTLMKVLTGVYRPNAGIIRIDGRDVQLSDPKAAQALGIGMIHQELNLAPDLTVAQNIFIGREPRRGFGLFLDDKTMNERTRELLAGMNLDIDPRSQVAGLTVAKQQMVEIVKAISLDSKVLIMDEPTAALSDAEIEELFVVIERLRGQGVGIVYISHRMAELQRICDRITVMRDGQYMDTVKIGEVTVDRIIAMMVGRELYQADKSAHAGAHADIVLEVKGLRRGRALRNIDLQLRRGEILGIAGLVGAGRTELARAIFGADPIDGGELYIRGRRIAIRSPHQAVLHGVGYLSEDRKQYGCLLDMDVKTNVAIASMPRYAQAGWMKDAEIERRASLVVDQLRVKTPSIHQPIKFLSGGNQQKAIIGKWLTRDCDILIFDEPTRGIDIGAKGEIYKLLDQLAAEGKSIIMISSELPEILRLSHRILVMCEGRITGELTNDGSVTQESIMHYATRRIG
ncbi:sugar ABC transporter ATP-binding protein [Paenibacillus methanolicus]|uniref:Ribose transport system ATP-binding protein n=1 Tax=Paenibacillus methanolicus TaxID=582686 RepID=A0A5S5CHQ9_9BACL|nr:sugar ABC transporter ATP-binding protein [Paenibacillus methanolicus]TYP79262.1 ribose transport system ATP-binding protein [Paenibacillus methanolicus]